MTKELVPIGGRQRAAFAQREAHGKLRLLAVGIDLYQPASGFQNLKTCANDAMAIQGCFADVHQLNADKEQLHLLTSKGNPVSRGLIIGKLRELAQTAEASNRILFFYSGHGHRIGDKFFLVPQDAYSDSDEKALISIEEVIAILNGSNAKQKIIVLDACLSGPDASHIKLLPARYSRKFLIDYLEKTNGVVILSSSRADQSSTTQSPNPKLSLMTHYAMEGLRGDPEALDDAFLTVDSLFGFVSSKVQRRAQSFQNEQQPVLHQTATGTIILGDFSAGILNPDTFDPGSHPIVKIELLAYTRAQVIEVLTEIKNWTYSQGHIESKVNDKLGEYFEEDLGRRASSLRRSLGFAAGDVAVEDDATITFPDGYFDIRYESENKKTGTFVSTISLESSWFQRLGDIEDITTALDVNPKEMRFSLSAKTSPMDAIPGLEARGWNVTSQLPRKVEAEWKGHIFIVEPTQITIRGFTLSELFGTSGDSEKAGSVTSAISAVTGRIVSAKLPPPEPSKSDEDEE